MTVQELYWKHISKLPPADRLRLLALIAGDIEKDCTLEEKPKRSIMELEGLGAEIWEGVDVAQYINEMRDEWDRKPNTVT